MTHHQPDVLSTPCNIAGPSLSSNGMLGDVGPRSKAEDVAVHRSQHRKQGQDRGAWQSRVHCADNPQHGGVRGPLQQNSHPAPGEAALPGVPFPAKEHLQQRIHPRGEDPIRLQLLLCGDFVNQERRL